MTNHWMKYGMLAGLVTVVLYMIIYFVNAKTMLGPLVQWGSLLIFIGAMAKAGIDRKNDNGGYLSFMDTFLEGFKTYAIAAIIYYIFYYILFNFIDPGLTELLKEQAIEAIEKMAGLVGGDGMEAAMDAIESQDFSIGIGSALMSLFMSILGGGIVALIVAVFIKKDPPQA